MRRVTNAFLARVCYGRRSLSGSHGTNLGSPSKPKARSFATVRLAGLALAMIVLGLIAPSPVPADGQAGTKASSLAGTALILRRSSAASVKADSPGSSSDPEPLPSIVFPPRPEISHRAGCCGSVSASCPGPYPHLLVYVAVPNAWADADRRHPLRAQWAKSLVLMEKRLKSKGIAAPPATVLHFVIGLQGLGGGDRADVNAELAAHHDLLVLPYVADRDAGEPPTRSSTTLKVIHSMAYAANHYTFDFYARVGDDAYLRIDYLAELVLIDRAFPLERAYIGYKFPNHRIPGSHSTHNFIVGMGFFLTQDFTRYVCREQDMLLDGFPEDGIVGSWFVGTKVDVIHEPRFHDIDHVKTVAYKPCSNTSLLLHHMWSRKNWEDVDGDGLLRC